MTRHKLQVQAINDDFVRKIQELQSSHATYIENQEQLHKLQLEQLQGVLLAVSSMTVKEYQKETHDQSRETYRLDQETLKLKDDIDRVKKIHQTEINMMASDYNIQIQVSRHGTANLAGT